MPAEECDADVAVTEGRLLCEPLVTGRLPRGTAVRISGRGRRITEVEGLSDPPDDALPWLAPGLIDLQVNGFGGYDVNAAEPDAAHIAAISGLLAARGVTGWCPTVTTSAHETALERIAAVTDAVTRSPETAHAVVGIHVEGPWLSPHAGARGVHPPEHIRAPSRRELDELLEAGRGLVRIVTLSPEWPEAIEVIEAVVAAGVVAAIGHTSATPVQIEAAVAAGARLSTHLGNGVSAMLPRHPNVIWSQLAADELTASFIADGHHLPAAALRSMIRAKGAQRCVLVSDSTAIAGLAPGCYDTPVGGRVELRADGRLAHTGSGYLAGSAVSLADCVPRASELGAIALPAAVKLASRTPAAMIGARGRGSLAPGGCYDLVVLEPEPLAAGRLSIREVRVGGRAVGADRDS